MTALTLIPRFGSCGAGLGGGTGLCERDHSRAARSIDCRDSVASDRATCAMRAERLPMPVVSVVNHFPQAPQHYKNLLADYSGLVHITVEVNAYDSEPCIAPSSPILSNANRDAGHYDF